MFSPAAHAAHHLALPSATTAQIGDTVTVLVQLDTAGTYVDAAQATVTYSNNVLQASSVAYRDSTFNFWVQEPTINNDNGTIKFIGGTAKGVSGSALPVAEITFAVKGTGTAQLGVTNAAVTANDGKGTNVLSTTQGATITVGQGGPAQTPTSTAAASTSQQTPAVAAPTTVVRQATPATTLPIAPQIRVPFYPDQGRWYDEKGDVVAFWDVPDDVTQVATKLSQTRARSPGR